MAGPAYTRLGVDERRRRLLELGADLFTRFAYDELSMSRIAKEAGISKALLYHYFPSKEAYFVATLEEKAAELTQRTAPDEALPPIEQLSGSLGAYLAWVEENAGSYEKLIRSASVPEVRALLDRVRGDTAQRIVDGIRGESAGDARAAHRRRRLAVVHGRRVPGLDRAPDGHAARGAPRPPAGRARRRRPRRRRGLLATSSSAAGVIFCRSTTNTSVSFGPIVDPEPCAP